MKKILSFIVFGFLISACSNANTSLVDCDIKGNISKSGTKIYHVPGQKYYDDTIIDEDNGEKWFCTEKEAQRAGWRKSKI